MRAASYRSFGMTARPAVSAIIENGTPSHTWMPTSAGSAVPVSASQYTGRSGLCRCTDWSSQFTKPVRPSSIQRNTCAETTTGIA